VRQFLAGFAVERKRKRGVDFFLSCAAWLLIQRRTVQFVEKSGCSAER
jgi:hypothetical protein